MGGEPGEKRTHVYVRLSPFAVHLKLSQNGLFISYTQKQNKELFFFNEWATISRSRKEDFRSRENSTKQISEQLSFLYHVADGDKKCASLSWCQSEALGGHMKTIFKYHWAPAGSSRQGAGREDWNLKGAGLSFPGGKKERGHTNPTDFIRFLIY